MTDDPTAAVDDLLQRDCEACGAKLTDAELEAAREADGPWLCAVHAAELVQVSDEPTPPAGDAAQ